MWPIWELSSLESMRFARYTAASSEISSNSKALEVALSKNTE